MRGTSLGYLAVQASADQLESSIVQVRLILTIVFTAAGLLTLLVGGVTASLLTRPIDLLVRSMRLISAGDLHHRAAVTSKDEVGFLAQTFNEMAASLESTTVELEATYFASMEALARAIDEFFLQRDRAAMERAAADSAKRYSWAEYGAIMSRLVTRA
jgi:HAMP domain-containing protein